MFIGPQLHVKETSQSLSNNLKSVQSNKIPVINMNEQKNPEN